MKHTVRVRLCPACRQRCATELTRRGKPTIGSNLDEDTSHVLVRLLCDACLKGAGITRIGRG